MSGRHVLLHARSAQLLLLILAALLAGAGLSRLLLPPGRLGIGPNLSAPSAQVQAVAAAGRPSLRARSEGPDSDGQVPIHDIPSSIAPAPFVQGARARNPAGEPPDLPTSPSLERKHDWRLDLQVGLSWQYAGGTRSRARHAPVSPPIGELR